MAEIHEGTKREKSIFILLKRVLRSSDFSIRKMAETFTSPTHPESNGNESDNWNKTYCCKSAFSTPRGDVNERQK